MRVGLIGWASASGNGGMDADIAHLAPWVTRWLVPRHPRLGNHQPYLDRAGCEVMHCRMSGDENTYREFLDGLDAVLFVEHPYLRRFDLMAECRARGILTCCIPMWEWWNPKHAWTQDVDMVWCVTEFTRNYLETLDERGQSHWRDRIHGKRWGVDLDQFPFRPRSRCETFVFANGNGGVAGRKGAAVIREAAEMAPNVDVLFLTQTGNFPKPMPPNVTIREANHPMRQAIYQEGDVFVAPSLWEGFGHSLYESQASGMPLITVDHPPMNEANPHWSIPSLSPRPQNVGGKRIAAARPDPSALARLMRDLRDANILQQSHHAREFIRRHRSLRDVIDELGAAIQCELTG